MEQNHLGTLLFRRQRMQDRAGDHLQQPAAHRQQHRGRHEPRERMGHQRRQQTQQQQTGRGRRLGEDDRAPVSEPVDGRGGDGIRDELHAEVHGDEQADLPQRNGVAVVEGHEEQRREIDDDSLDKHSEVAGLFRVVVSEVHCPGIRISAR